MLHNDEHELLKRLRPHINDPIMFDMVALLKHYEAKALEKLVETGEAGFQALQGEIKSLRKIQARLKAKDLE
jgi:hypothetical protein